MRNTTPYAIVSSLTLVSLMILSCFVSFCIVEDGTQDRQELDQIEAKMFATSPGHPVFGEYVGAHWCGPCMSSASPSLDNLKTSNPEDITIEIVMKKATDSWTESDF